VFWFELYGRVEMTLCLTEEKMLFFVDYFYDYSFDPCVVIPSLEGASSIYECWMQLFRDGCYDTVSTYITLILSPPLLYAMLAFL
jgi:hypothetical protein